MENTKATVRTAVFYFETDIDKFLESFSEEERKTVKIYKSRPRRVVIIYTVSITTTDSEEEFIKKLKKIRPIEEECVQ